MNIEINGNDLHIDHHDIYFDYNIRQIDITDDRVIVLLDIPNGADDPANIFCVDFEANILWQIEQSGRFFKKTGSPKAAGSSVCYTGMYIRESDGLLQVNDFLGRRFLVDPEDGHILEKNNEGREW